MKDKNQRRLHVLLARIEHWEGVSEAEAVYLGEELLLDIKQCLESVLADENEDPYERPQK